ncbi:hypothetical protein BT69DRAFT_1282889 [Atractiella rhizophila]|nr:hypothetical protein BT69DRAFT_1282889 [Atractiella rhizophila]
MAISRTRSSSLPFNFTLWPNVVHESISICYVYAIYLHYLSASYMRIRRRALSHLSVWKILRSALPMSLDEHSINDKYKRGFEVF